MEEDSPAQKYMKLSAALIVILIGLVIAYLRGSVGDWATTSIALLFVGLGFVFMHFEDISSFKAGKDGIEARKFNRTQTPKKEETKSTLALPLNLIDYLNIRSKKKIER